MLGTKSLSLPGTHAIIFPWVPPENLPENNLIAIRDQLVSIFHEFNRTKHWSLTQSSPTTGDEGGDEGLRKEEMYALFSEPPRKA